MVDALLQLTVYGFLVRTVVEFIQGVIPINSGRRERILKGLAVAVSAAFVYWVGLNPVALLGMGKMKTLADGAAAQPVGVALLAAAAMGSNDLANMLMRLGSGRVVIRWS